MNEKLKEAIELSEKGKYKQAVKILESLLKKEPMNEQALFEIAYALLSLEDDGPALDWLKVLLSVNPEYPGARDWYSRTVAKYGNKIEAAEIKYSDLRSKPNGELGMGVSPYGWTDCAEYYFLGSQPNRAKEILDEYFKYESGVTSYESHKSAPYRLYSKILRSEGCFEEALSMCLKALGQKHPVPADHELRVWLLLDLRRDSDAILEYDKMIKEVFGGMDRFVQIQPLKKVIDEIRLTRRRTEREYAPVAADVSAQPANCRQRRY
jgi:tetratricopeptide (TPR) repeat protein